MTYEDIKILNEYMGECWHNDPIVVPCSEGEMLLPCKKCGMPPYRHTFQNNWHSVGKLKEAMEERGDWPEFKRHWKGYPNLDFFSLSFPVFVLMWLKDKHTANTEV